MLKLLRTTALAAAAAATSFVAAPERAQAQSYQIDCAILLCLSGGWPASVPCARARAEFIRRITPWPVEPPLQIWRCPMGASFNVDPSELNRTRLFDILMEVEGATPKQSFPNAPFTDFSLEPQPAVVRRTGGQAGSLPEGFALQFVDGEYSEENGTADIDISGDAFDFVRSIRVFNVTYARQSNGREDCNRSANVLMGAYGTQGDFHWNRSSVRDLPEAHEGMEGYGRDCPRIYHRSVFVEWRDYQGNYGFEQVNY
ncbi:MAG: hypothetical protein HEP70_19215 [Rhodobiaceae bacterium]|uniref:Secreted protein n=1 Tax=Phaeobacter piscinae TaxID=1580596 RepID=A0ABN5DKG3_9RHOB|nr:MULTISPECIES: hypothetical protein [Rhodobacterales]ATG37952.1 hypothetical protein PhaeoP36_03876 [Phaeobacter piscinae]AUQ88473.1 hypothetical protein PhaeoP42_03877 [Phaeobacter piscinae]MCE8000980.1 hypothetical protein [Rhodobiaceae bacterium]